MKKQVWIAIVLMIASFSAFAENMAYQSHGTMNAEQGQYLFQNWTQLPDGSYVRCTTNGSSNTHIESSAGWNIVLEKTYRPCIAQYDACVIGDSTYSKPPDGSSFSILGEQVMK